MPYPPELSPWITEVSTHLVELSRCQARLLAIFSYAVMLMHHADAEQRDRSRAVFCGATAAST